MTLPSLTYATAIPVPIWYRDTKTGDAARHWRWRGFITDYYTAESVLQENPSAGTPTEAMLTGNAASGCLLHLSCCSDEHTGGTY